MTITIALGLLVSMGLAVFVAVDETRNKNYIMAAIYEFCAVILIFALLFGSFNTYYAS